MKPFACDQCTYSTNYNHDLRRHKRTHGASKLAWLQTPGGNHAASKLPQPGGTQQTTLGGGGQALNLSNNINVPPQPTHQVINIQPTSPWYNQPTPEYYDVRLKENFKLFIAGPSGAGKTWFVRELMKNLDIFAKAPPKILTLVYKVYQPIYKDMGLDHVIEDGPHLKERLFEIAMGRPMLVIFDDMMNSTSLKELADLFTVHGRHHNLSMIFLSQQVYNGNNQDFKQIKRNCDYMALFKNPQNAQEIRTLSSQMTPGRMELVSYFTQATQNGHAYLFINLTQQCKDQVKYLSQLFNETHVVKAHMNGGRRDLTDGQNNGRTNFAKMFLKSQFLTANPTVPPTHWAPVGPTSTPTQAGPRRPWGSASGPVGPEGSASGVHPSTSTQTVPGSTQSGGTQTGPVVADSVSTQTPPSGGNQVQTQTDLESDGSVDLEILERLKRLREREYINDDGDVELEILERLKGLRDFIGDDGHADLEILERLKRLRERGDEGGDWDHNEDQQLLHALNSMGVSTQTEPPQVNGVETQTMGAQVNGVSSQTEEPNSTQMVSVGVGSNTVRHDRGTQVIQRVLGKRKYDFEEPDAKKPKMIDWRAEMQAHIDQLQTEHKKQIEEMQVGHKKVLDEVTSILEQMEGDTSTTNDDLSMEGDSSSTNDDLSMEGDSSTTTDDLSMEGDSSTTTDDLTMEERSGKRKRDSSEDEPVAKKFRIADTAPHLPWYLIREARPPFRVRHRLYSEIGMGNPPLPWYLITERFPPYRTRYRLYNEFGDSVKTEVKERKLKLYSEYDSPVQCEECEETFDSVKAYEAHNCKPSVYGCGICGKNLLTRSAHDQHKRTMHNKISPKLVKR